MSKKIIWILAILASLGAIAGGCKKKQSPDLVIASPHNEFIEQEFTNAFVAWHAQRFGQTVKIEWRDMGGTKAITKYLRTHIERTGASEIDIYFGGGAPDHQFLAGLSLLQPMQLPEETLNQIPETVRGIRWRDTEAGWCGACLSSFGIIYNAKLMSDKHLTAPTQWSDLADLTIHCTILMHLLKPPKFSSCKT